MVVCSFLFLTTKEGLIFVFALVMCSYLCYNMYTALKLEYIPRILRIINSILTVMFIVGTILATIFNKEFPMFVGVTAVGAILLWILWSYAIFMNIRDIS